MKTAAEFAAEQSKGQQVTTEQRREKKLVDIIVEERPQTWELKTFKQARESTLFPERIYIAKKFRTTEFLVVKVSHSKAGLGKAWGVSILRTKNKKIQSQKTEHYADRRSAKDRLRDLLLEQLAKPSPKKVKVVKKAAKQEKPLSLHQQMEKFGFFPVPSRGGVN